MMNRVHDVRVLYHAALRGVRPDVLLDRLDFERMLGPPGAFRRVVAVGAGKAAMAMAGALEAKLGDAITEGLVVVPHGYPETFPEGLPRPRRIEVAEGGHPLPDASGVAATRRTLALAEACGPDDALLALLSGGGSALWSAFAEGITLDDARALYRLLLRSGADIHQMNTVRKHLSRIAGGRLAAAAYPATVLAPALSDVVGDDLSVIASGPTVPDRTTFRDAVLVLQQLDLWEKAPASVRAHLRRGREDPAMETPKPGRPAFERALTVLIGGNRDALRAAAEEARRRGYAARIVSDRVTGEAREVGRRQAEAALAVREARPVCLLWGGETTVTVRGQGKGGRNQELALAAALALEGAPRPVAFLSGGTDGLDGPTDAAGAWVTNDTAPAARARGLDPEAFLENNDAYTFFERMGALLKPGPTHTNVMDVQIALVGEEGEPG
jgi:hydroxypyruvate reductase